MGEVNTRLSEEQQTLWLAEAEPEEPTGIMSIDLNIRKGPGKNHKVVKRAKQGEQVVILDDSGSWYKIRLEDGTEGYGYHKYIQTSTPES